MQTALFPVEIRPAPRYTGRMEIKQLRLWIGLQIAATGLFPLLSPAQTVTDMPIAHIKVVGTNVVNLGKVTAESLKLVTFKLHNTSVAPATVTDIVTTCPCIRAFPEQLTIPPKEVGEINVEFNPALVRGGPFNRAVWLETNTARTKPIPLVLTGEVISLLNGVPDGSVTFNFGALGETWTTQLVVTTLSPDISLGTLSIPNSPDMDVLATVKTNQTSGATNNTYEVALTAKPLKEGRTSVKIGLPLVGEKGPLTQSSFFLVANVGTPLTVTPNQFLLTRATAPISRLFSVRPRSGGVGRMPAPDPKALQFSPDIEGVTFACQPSKRNKNALDLTVTVTPEAAGKILAAEERPSVTLSYPGHRSATLSFFSRPEAAPQ